jgi:PAS domain-containing protein
LDQEKPNDLAAPTFGEAIHLDTLITFPLVSKRRRRMAEQALKESETQNRAITQSAYDAIVTCDGAGQIVRWNSRWPNGRAAMAGS